MKCSDKGYLKIQKAHLILSTQDMCPLQFSGIYSNNFEEECKHPNKLENQDVTEIMKNLYFFLFFILYLLVLGIE